MNRRLLLAALILSVAVTCMAQSDTLPPQLTCIDKVYRLFNYECVLYAWPSEMIQSLADNQTDSLDIQLGVRKACTGDGFPENSPNVEAYGGESPFQMVEVWARDPAGNTSSCLCSLIVADSYNWCDPLIEIVTDTPEGEGIGGGIVTVEGSHCYFDSINYERETTVPTWWQHGGISSFGTLVPSAGYHFTVTPSKNLHPLNGLSTFDLVLIQKHLLGIEPLDSPYKIIAADANQDGQLTSFDIFLLKQLLLGVTSELPNGRSWRFIPQSFVFPNPANPFETPFPESIEVLPSDPMYNFGKHFYGIKIGDVNDSADPGQ